METRSTTKGNEQRKLLAVNDHPISPGSNGLDDLADVVDFGDWEMGVRRSLEGEDDRSGGAESGSLVVGRGEGGRVVLVEEDVESREEVEELSEELEEVVEIKRGEGKCRPPNRYEHRRRIKISEREGQR